MLLPLGRNPTARYCDGSKAKWFFSHVAVFVEGWTTAL
jgi:hypothetical protein